MNSKLPLSAFIICKNEEGYLENCLRSLEQCSEIVVVDSGSTDGTEALALRYQQKGWPIRFLRQDWLGYSAQKQFAMEQCTQPWRLNIDADERLDRDLKAILGELLAAPEDVAGWHLDLRPYLIGYGYTPRGVGEKTKLRLVRAGRAKFDLARAVHEGMIVEGRIKTALRGALLHYRPLPLDEIVLKLNNYSTLKADQVIAEGGTPRYARLLVNPPMYFLRHYFRRRLFQCGVPGLIEAASGAVYSFLTEAKIFQRHAARLKPPRDNMDEA